MNTTDSQPPKLSAVEIQQEYYEAVGDVDWELYKKKQRKHLLQKVAVALCGPPIKVGDLKNDSDDLKLQGYELKDEETIMAVFNKICEQAKYSHNGENILISFLRVVCVIPSKEVPFYKITPRNYWVNLHTKKSDVNILLFHVFSVRKCISMKIDEKSCKIFIDHDARVYQNWDDYLTNNNLPKCVMVVPTSGEYRGIYESDASAESMPIVKLTVAPSPALGINARVLSVADGVSTAANIGGIIAIIGAVAVPAVAPVALGTALGIGITTGVYGIVRSSIRLTDRKKHEQSNNLLDSEARSYWINILVSTAGISFSAAGQILSWAAASGINVKILMNAVNILKYANIGSGFIGVANSLGEMIHKYRKYDETPSKLEIFQFTTSVLFLGIGVMSNQTAQEIVQDAQAKTINEVRDSLSSNVKRKMFDKVTAETRRVQGTIKGNSDIIKALNNIENKDDFFAKIARMNKDLNKNKLRISLAPDGNPLINNQHKINLSDIYGLGKSGRNQLFSEYGPAKVTTKNAPTRIYASNVSSNGMANSREEASQFNIRPEEIMRITNFLMSLNNLDQEFVAEIISQMTASAHDAFLLLCAELVASFLPNEIAFFASNENVHHYKVQIVLELFFYLKSLIPECDYKNDNSFIIVLKEFVRDGRVKKETILSLKSKILHNITTNNNNDAKKYNDIHKFRKTYTARFMNLCAGEIINISHHKILIKGITIEKLTEWLKGLSQNKCDLFIKMCFRIISILKPAEIDELNLLNPDEDIVMRVSYFLLNETEIEINFEKMLQDPNNNISISDAVDLKRNLMEWRHNQSVRNHETCSNCKGICFFKS